MNRYLFIKLLTLVGFGIVFELIVFLSRHATMTPMLLVALPFAASLGGRAIAYMEIGAPVRHFFTKVVKHSCGEGESVEPRDDKGPIIYVIGSWMSCPLCAGTWVAALLMLLTVLEPEMGRLEIYVLGAAGLASVITRTHEMVEWIGRNQWEQTGRINRINKNEIAQVEYNQLEELWNSSQLIEKR